MFFDFQHSSVALEIISRWNPFESQQHISLTALSTKSPVNKEWLRVAVGSIRSGQKVKGDVLREMAEMVTKVGLDFERPRCLKKLILGQPIKDTYKL